jgi:hypothetical protein
VSVAVGFLAWALSLAIDSLSDPTAGGRILDIRLFSSTAPIPILVEGLAKWLLFVATAVWLWHLVPRRFPVGHRWSAVARNLLTSLVSLGATILVLETLCRVVAVVAPAPQGFPTRAQVLWSRRYVRLNSLGYRDRERSLASSDGRARILFVGDSFGHGFGINDVRNRVSERLQEALDQRLGGRRFEVINVARPHTHTMDQIRTLPRALAYRPKYVIVLYVFNDIDHVRRPGRPAVSPPGSFAARLHPLRLLVSNSALAEQVVVRISRGRGGRGNRSDPYMDDAILQEHLAALERLVQMCREAGAEARLVPFDIRTVLAQEFVRRYRRLEEGARARGIPVWSLEHAFDGHAHASLIVNHLDHHPNELAHELAARIIVDRFQAELDRPEATSR